MAKSSGLGATVSVDDSGGTLRDISNDVLSFTLKDERGEQVITGVDKSAMERLLLVADRGFGLSGVFNPATNKSHDVFKTVASTSVTRTVTVVLNTSPTATATAECVISNYNLSRGANGELTWSVDAKLADGTAPAWT